MPRINRTRSVYAEQNLARRINIEREERGWSADELVKRMEAVGCKIHLSALYKIEKADPPRRITVDELVGFSEAFGIAIDDLLAPVEVSRRAARKALRDELRGQQEASWALLKSMQSYLAHSQSILDAARTPDLAELLADNGVLIEGTVTFEGMDSSEDDSELYRFADECAATLRDMARNREDAR